MRLAAKFTVVLTVALFLGLAISGYVRIERERTLFDRDMRRDGALVGATLAAALGRVWELEGRDRGLGLVRQANTEAGDVSVRWIDRDELQPSVLQPILRGEEAFAEDSDTRGRPRLYAYVPVRFEGDVEGAVAVAHLLRPERRYIRGSILGMIITAGSIALVAGGAVLLFGAFFIGRPLARVAKCLKRTGGGDLAARVDIRQRDEIGELGSALNAMLDRLAQTQQRLAAETAARLAGEDQLRHADRLTTVGMLSAAVAHELGTPLNVVLGRAGMIGSGELVGDAAKASAKIVTEQVERMARYLRNLLDFSRDSSREATRSDLQEVVQKTVDLLDPFAHKRSVEIRFDPPESSKLVVEMDPGQIQQVLSNLIVNAIQAMPDGGRLEIEVERRDARRLGREATAEEAFAAAVIRDHGAGISPEDLGRMFEPFFSTKPAGEGTGLGLAVASEIVRDHEGWIDVDSTPGEGTTVTVFLPATG